MRRERVRGAIPASWRGLGLDVDQSALQAHARDEPGESRFQGAPHIDRAVQRPDDLVERRQVVDGLGARRCCTYLFQLGASLSVCHAPK